MSTDPQTIDALVANHRDFLAFVERRVGDRALAEEIVQDAFVKSLARGDEIHDSAVGWFYRVLRNAVIDHQRRQAMASRRLDAFAAELEAPAAPEVAETVCRCVARLAGTLAPDYADALTRIEVDGVPVKDYAAERDLSASNARVRIFRARQALRKRIEHIFK